MDIHVSCVYRGCLERYLGFFGVGGVNMSGQWNMLTIIHKVLFDMFRLSFKYMYIRAISKKNFFSKRFHKQML